MVEPTARIRHFELSDVKAARFYSGKAQMEGLTAANVKAYKNPLIIALWFGLSSAFIQFMQWWPAGTHGFLEYLKPLPAFFSMSLPIMFLIDWLNRPTFDRNLQDTLRKPDLVDIPTYYSRSPASGFWFLELGDRFIGLIAIDASLDSSSDEVAIKPDSKFTGTKPSYSQGTSKTATIRHFYVEEPFRAAFAEDDLLEYALNHVFTTSPEIQVVRAVGSALEPYIGKALRKQGFKPVKTLSTVGVFNWEVRLHQLRRGDWHPEGN